MRTLGEPLREGFAIRAMPHDTDLRQRTEGGQRRARVAARGRRASSTPGVGREDRSVDGCGVDQLGVRRKLAPVLRAYARGNLARARRALSTVTESDRAKKRLREDVFANSTRSTRAAQEATLQKIADTADFPLVPVTDRSLETIAAALKAAGYRSGAAYLSLLQQIHEGAGHEWKPQFRVRVKEYVRSLERGIGPARRAATVRLEVVLIGAVRAPSPAVPDGPILPVDFVHVACAWMMRGAEAAAVLGEQVSVDPDMKAATIDLGATKTNPAGRECPRTLRCCCHVRTDPQAGGEALCPVHALVRVLRECRRRGISRKGPLFPRCDGAAPSSSAVVSTLRAVAQTNLLTEHSMRRMGAQFYARRNVPTKYIQFLGRWGGETVKKYIGEALRERAAGASVTAAASSSDAIVGNFGPRPGETGQVSPTTQLPRS